MLNRVDQKAYMLVWHKQHYRKKRLWINALKKRPCEDCGIEYPSPAMEFDHVRGTKLFSIAVDLCRHGYASLKREIAKCEVVCANCHAIRTAKQMNYLI